MATLTNVFLHLILYPFQLHISKKCCNFAREMRILAGYIWQYVCRLVCMLGLVCSFASCGWQEAKEVIVLADSIDQTKHVIYDDTAAIGKAIRSLDNPFGRLLMPNTLGKAYYYMGRNLEDNYQQVAQAAKCYIEADRLQIDDPIYRGRVNSCMGYICRQNNTDSLALIFYERAAEDFQKSGNEWYYAQNMLDIVRCQIDFCQHSTTDSLLRLVHSFQLDSAYHAHCCETQGLYFYAQQQYDSALVYFKKGLNYWQSERKKSFSYLKILQVYYDLNQLHLALPYARLIVEHSTNPNYISNAYYCLMQDAKSKNDAEMLSQYSHARIDALKLLRVKANKYTEASPPLEEYLQDPHPWRWMWIVVSAMVAICIILAIGAWVYRQQNYTACQQIHKLSIALQNQELLLSKELHYHNLNTIIAEAQSKYHTPLNRWQEYSVLKKDLDYCLHDWIEALDKLPLLEREKIFCTLSLVYSHLTDVSIAGYMFYSKYGIRTMKNRILKKLGISASEFSDFLQNLTYVQ